MANFGHLLQKHDAGQALLAEFNAQLAGHRIERAGGVLVEHLNRTNPLAGRRSNP